MLISWCDYIGLNPAKDRARWIAKNQDRHNV